MIASQARLPTPAQSLPVHPASAHRPGYGVWGRLKRVRLWVSGDSDWATPQGGGIITAHGKVRIKAHKGQKQLTANNRLSDGSWPLSGGGRHGKSTHKARKEQLLAWCLTESEAATGTCPPPFSPFKNLSLPRIVQNRGRGRCFFPLPELRRSSSPYSTPSHLFSSLHNLHPHYFCKNRVRIIFIYIL